MPAEDFIIVKKRKKYRFARFSELPNCYEADEFIRMRDIWLDGALPHIELGAGTGLFLVEQAKCHPGQKFIAIDVKADRLFAGAREAEAAGLDNIIFVRSNITQLSEIFSPHSVDQIWLTFSDPYPKKRHTKHRLTHPTFLRLYAAVLEPKQGVLHFKTDNQQLFQWSLEQFVAHNAQLQHLSFDLHQSNEPDEYKIMTTYEQRFVAEGLPIYSVDVLLAGL